LADTTLLRSASFGAAVALCGERWAELSGRDVD